MVTCGDELATILNEKKSHSDYSNKAIFYKWQLQNYTL